MLREWRRRGDGDEAVEGVAVVVDGGTGLDSARSGTAISEAVWPAAGIARKVNSLGYLLPGNAEITCVTAAIFLSRTRER